MKPPPLTEAQVTQQVTGYLRAKGYMPLRLQSGLVRGHTRGSFMRLGADGLPDYVAVHPERKALFVEIKRRGAKLRPSQERWRDDAARSGYVVALADDIEAFKAWFESNVEAG